MESSKKPIGVYILAICLFLRFGVFQLVSDFSLISEADRSTPFLIALIMIGRNVFVAGAAVWMFSGENHGRLALLGIVTLNVLWTVFSVITYYSYKAAEGYPAEIFNILFNPMFWLVTCWWYLNRGNVIKYFKRDEFEES